MQIVTHLKTATPTQGFSHFGMRSNTGHYPNLLLLQERQEASSAPCSLKYGWLLTWFNFLPSELERSPSSQLEFRKNEMKKKLI